MKTKIYIKDVFIGLMVGDKQASKRKRCRMSIWLNDSDLQIKFDNNVELEAEVSGNVRLAFFADKIGGSEIMSRHVGIMCRYETVQTDDES
jgi:ribosome biogenesis SPOUT family RNA methylase Rps3